MLQLTVHVHVDARCHDPKAAWVARELQKEAWWVIFPRGYQSWHLVAT